METRIYIYLNGVAFTKHGTQSLVDFFIEAEAIQDEYITRKLTLRNETIQMYYFNTLEED